MWQSATNERVRLTRFSTHPCSPADYSTANQLRHDYVCGYRLSVVDGPSLLSLGAFCDVDPCENSGDPSEAVSAEKKEESAGCAGVRAGRITTLHNPRSVWSFYSCWSVSPHRTATVSLGMASTVVGRLSAVSLWNAPCQSILSNGVSGASLNTQRRGPIQRHTRRDDR